MSLLRRMYIEQRHQDVYIYIDIRIDVVYIQSLLIKQCHDVLRSNEISWQRTIQDLCSLITKPTPMNLLKKFKSSKEYFAWSCDHDIPMSKQLSENVDLYIHVIRLINMFERWNVQSQKLIFVLILYRLKWHDLIRFDGFSSF